MSTLADRLRGVVRPGGGAQTSVDGSVAGTAEGVADVLDGSWCESAGRRYLVVDRTFLPGHRHGRVSVADSLPPPDDAWPRFHLLAPEGEQGRRAQERLLFVDLETTGLAGGAGTYAFLVGCGWFDGGVFRTRQFFLSDYGAERALLEAVATTAAGASTVVSYNGRSFDVPLIDTRFLLHRLETPFAGMPHVDMLHAARRLWRSGGEDPGAGGGCRLVELEVSQFGHEREGDVPGFEIPGRYFHYVRSGDARPLAAVLEHNRLDVLSLAMLTARAAFLLDEGPAAARTSREAFGLGSLYARGGRVDAALECFARAEALPGDLETRAQALRALAVTCRRLRRHDDAAAAWRRALELDGCPPPIAREATEALAVHHEHRLRDLDAARRFARRSLELAASRARQHAVEHRLARLDRKCGHGTGLPQSTPPPLF